ncbi:TonB-dependent siderophore receptor [Marinivivus vitaminiproducens]|uniref:TonB-dependent siderophore receptor n=1 Tax=Marinivivus vitaminiproducens TaxID=3035935 RepID=UPI0027A4A431|nr:TonB-dependent siderophore receptor [Geminicoccaceae bacterium SCSIO 64248]
MSRPYRRVGGSPSLFRRALLSASVLVLPAMPAAAQDEAPGGVAAGGALRLPTLEISARPETATGRVEGYVANRSRSGTKTDTPILETPQSISIVTSDQMEERNVDTVAEALRYTAGAQVEGFGYDPRYDQIILRGFDLTTFADFRDNLRQPQGGGLALWRDDPYSLERIDIIRGPASVLYGQSSPGGLINKVTKRPLEVARNQAQIEVGNHSRYQGKFDLSGPLDEDGELLYRVVTLGRLSETPRDGSEHDDRLLFAPSFTWRPNEDTTLTFLASYMNFRVEPAPGVFVSPTGSVSHRWVGDAEFNKHQQDQWGVGYEFAHAFNDAVTVRQNLRYQDVDLTARYLSSAGLVDPDGSVIDRTAFLVEDNLYIFSVDNQVELQADTGPLAHTIIAGVDYQRMLNTFKLGSGPGPTLDLDSPDYRQDVVTPDININDRQLVSDQAGLYIQDQVAWGGWRLTGGLRQDVSRIDTNNRLTGLKDNRDDDKLTGRAGLLYLFESGFAPYVSYATSFFPVAGETAEGEPFEPTTGRQYEAGLKYQPPGWNTILTASLFDIKQKNVETDDPASDNMLDTIQEGEITSRGLELEAVASLANGLNLQASYTYQDVEITESNNGDEGNRPAGIPEHMAAIWADYTVPEGRLAGIGGGAGVRYMGSSFGTNAHDGNNEESYTLVDAEIHYEWRGYRLAVNADNLLDKDYVQIKDGFSYRAPGRTVIASLGVTW